MTQRRRSTSTWVHQLAPLLLCAVILLPVSTIADPIQDARNAARHDILTEYLEVAGRDFNEHWTNTRRLGRAREAARPIKRVVKWPEVLRDPEVQRLSSKGYDALRWEYFRLIILPELETDEIKAVWTDFTTRTKRRLVTPQPADITPAQQPALPPEIKWVLIWAAEPETVKKAAQQDDVDAQALLGDQYLRGKGVEYRGAEAVRWFRAAAEQGSSWAQYRLGLMYHLGEGVPQNFNDALKWYRSAAEQGEPWAQVLLADMYYFGRALPTDDYLAYVWSNLAAARAGAAELLREEAVDLRGRAARHLTKEQLLDAQALAARWRPNISGKSLSESRPEPKPEAGKETPGRATRVFTGTGFFVTGNGHLLTNAHVVEQCRELRARQQDGRAVAASVVAEDRENDLALLRSGTASPAVAKFNSRELRLGQSIVIYGFPLSGLLSSSGNLTTGNIAALSGPADDARLIQITAPIQPGNSGGPVLDSAGAVIGVVVSKLDALAVAERIRDIPQNVNFAINGNVAIRFLESKHIRYLTSADEEEISIEAIGDLATRFTVRVECLR